MTQWRYFNTDRDVVFANFPDGHTESHLVTADCIQAWIAEGNTPLPCEPPPIDTKEQAKAELAESDSDMARIVEDLINAMLTKDLITESDIPQSAHDKMAKRVKLRSALK